MNPQLMRPEIYNEYVPTFKLQSVLRIRLISHNLAIETGKFSKNETPRSERLCSCGEMEDEKHFLLSCHQYSHIRKKYLQPGMSIADIMDSRYTPNYIYELTECRKLYK